MITLRERQLSKQFCSFDPITMGALMGGGGQLLNMGGTLFGGLFGAGSESDRAINLKNAGDQSIKYIRNAAKRGQAEANAKLDMARADLSPFRDAGAEAGTTLVDLLLGRQVPRQLLQASDLFNFQSELGSRNINRELAARGLYGSGAGLETLARFNNQLVGEEGQRMTDRLMSLTQLGANAGGHMADMTYRTGLGLADMIYNSGVQSANTYYNAASGAANATANAGHLMANMGQSLFSQAGQGLQQYGNFMMQKPMIDQSMRMTDMLMGKMGGGMTGGNSLLDPQMR